MYKKYIDWENKEYIIKNNAEWIPNDILNFDYNEYLAWLAEGNIPEPWQPEEAE